MTERLPGRYTDRECVLERKSVCMCVLSIKDLIIWLLLWGTNLSPVAAGQRGTKWEVINYTPPSFLCQSKLTGWREKLEGETYMLLPPQLLNTHAHTHECSAPAERQDTAAWSPQSHRHTCVQPHSAILNYEVGFLQMIGFGKTTS